MFSHDDIVPVVMFHSIGLEKTDWIFSHVSEPVKTFQKKIAGLVSSGYQFLFWRDLYDHMAGVRRAPRKSIMLTFDDGYLDNWVYVFPILKRYGVKATIFVNPEFVDPDNLVRPNLESAWSGEAAKDQRQDCGFLNWQEMRLMEKSGLVDIQSHALSHTWYFSGPRLIDFHKPGSREYPWMAWNLRPEQKPFYMRNDQNKLVPWGTPVYEHEKALICKRYFPPEAVTEAIVNLVKDRGGENYFCQEDCEKDLRKYHDSLMKSGRHKGRFESDEDFTKRIFKELADSKEIIEKQLDKNVDFICWPGGGYNEVVLSMAKEAGYKAWTLSSRDKTSFRNRFGIEPAGIKRIGSASKYRTRNGKEYGAAGKFYFLNGIERHKGSFLCKWLSRLFMIFAIVRSKF